MKWNKVVIHSKGKYVLWEERSQSHPWTGSILSSVRNRRSLESSMLFFCSYSSVLLPVSFVLSSSHSFVGVSPGVCFSLVVMFYMLFLVTFFTIPLVQPPSLSWCLPWVFPILTSFPDQFYRSPKISMSKLISCSIADEVLSLRTQKCVSKAPFFSITSAGGLKPSSLSQILIKQ